MAVFLAPGGDLLAHKWPSCLFVSAAISANRTELETPSDCHAILIVFVLAASGCQRGSGEEKSRTGEETGRGDRNPLRRRRCWQKASSFLITLQVIATACTDHAPLLESRCSTLSNKTAKSHGPMSRRIELPPLKVRGTFNATSFGGIKQYK